MTGFSPTTNPNAARGDDDDDHTIVVPPPAPGDLAVVLPDGRRLWLSLPPLAPLLSPVPALLDGPAYDETAVRSILRDALDVTERPHKHRRPLLPKDRARSPRQRTTPRASAAQLSRRRRSSNSDPANFRPCRQRGGFPARQTSGRQWTYDSRNFVALSNNGRRKHVKQAQARPDATGAARPFGARLRSAGTASDGRLGRMIRNRKSASPSWQRASSSRRSMATRAAVSRKCLRRGMCSLSARSGRRPRRAISSR